MGIHVGVLLTAGQRSAVAEQLAALARQRDWAGVLTRDGTVAEPTRAPVRTGPG